MLQCIDPNLRVRWKIFVLVSLITSLLLLFSLFFLSPSEVGRRAESGEYIFLEFWVNEHGKILEGKPFNLFIDFPKYWLNEDSHVLEGFVNSEFIQLNSSLKLIYGSGTSLSGGIGGGTASDLFGVYSLPFKDKTANLEIKDLSGDGTVVVRVNEASISLNPGGKWKSTFKTIFKHEGGVVEVEKRITLINHGFVKPKLTSSD